MNDHFTSARGVTVWTMIDLRLASPAYVRKPVSTLAITPKATKISLLARKTWNVLLHCAQRAGLDKEMHAAPLSEIIRGLDFNSKDLKIVKDHLRAMVSTTVEWQSPTIAETPAWTLSGLLAHARLYKCRGEIWVEWSYAGPMRDELLDPAVYAKLPLEIISQFSTHAALVLYEIGKRYVGVGQTARQSWRWWLPVLTGRPVDERSTKLEYRIFKRDCLRCAVAQVNEISDLEMKLVEHKLGRSISELQFHVKKRPPKDFAFIESLKPVNLELLARAERVGVGHAHAEQLYAAYGEEAVVSALGLLEKRLAAGFPEPVRDPHGYLKALLSSPVAATDEDQVVREEEKSVEDAAQRVEKAKLGWVKRWLLREHEQIADEIASLSAARQDELISQLIADMTERKIHPARAQCLSTKGWRHPMVRQDMISYYASGAYGPDWNKPTAEQLLEIAAAR